MSPKRIISLLLLVLFCGTAWKLGYQFGAVPHTPDTPSTVATEPPADVKPASTPSVSSRNPDSSSARNSATQPPRTQDGDNKPDSGPQSQLIANHGLKKDYDEISAIFSKTPIGKTMATASTLLHLGRYPGTEAAQLVQNQLDQLEADPKATFAEIQQNLLKLGPQHHSQRQYFIQFAARLDIDPRAKSDFLAETIRRSALLPISSSSDKPSPSDTTVDDAPIALNALLENSTDSAEAETLLRDVLGKTAHPEIRSALMAVFESRYPDRARLLRTELAR